MRQRLSQKCFHSALRDAPRITESLRQQTQFPLRTKAMRKTFFPINNMFRAGVPLLSHERREYAALRRHRIDGVLHHGELARSNRAQRAMTTGGNSDRMLNLLP